MSTEHFIFQVLTLLPFVGQSFQYINYNYRSSSHYGSSSSSGLYDPWFIGISSGLLGLLLITLMVIFVRHVIKKRKERRQSVVRAAHLDGRYEPGIMTAQNPYIIEGDRSQSQTGWSSPTPNLWNGPNDPNPQPQQQQYQQQPGTWADQNNYATHNNQKNTTEGYEPTQSGWNQTRPETASQFVPAFSYGTQFSNTPPNNNEGPHQAPVSTIYSSR